MILSNFTSNTLNLNLKCQFVKLYSMEIFEYFYNSKAIILTDV